MKKILSLALVLAMALIAGLASAESQATEPVPAAQALFDDLIGVASDYSDADNWMQIPEITKEVDTFYIYPTAYNDHSEGAPDICGIDNEAMRQAAQGTLRTNGTAFEESTNVFAPYYRQTNLVAAESLDNAGYEAFCRQEQRTDIFAALDYYFEHYNQGRPFILAGHSQGSCMTKIVLKDYMKAHPEYYGRMVAAYMIGYAISARELEEYPHLKFAEGADDTGVIISWNTEGPNNGSTFPLVLAEGGLCINPISWTRDDAYAPASDNLGSRIQREDGSYEIVMGIADARIDLERGSLICTTKDYPYTLPPGFTEDFFGPESLHGGDYPLYYNNIQENVRNRIEHFFAE